MTKFPNAAMRDQTSYLDCNSCRFGPLSVNSGAGIFRCSHHNTNPTTATTIT